MEAKEAIEAAENFLREKVYSYLFEQSRKGHNHIIIDYKEVILFNLDLAEAILVDTENTHKAFEIASKNILEGISRVPQSMNFRFKNLIKDQLVKIGELRTKHLGQLIVIEGTVRQKSDVRPKTISTKYECPSCGNTIPLLQLDSKIKEPSMCNCGRRGKFRLISRELEDTQWLSVEESIDFAMGDRARKLKVLLESDLVSPFSEKKTHPGNKVRITGILKTVAVELRNGAISTQSEIILEANYVESIEESFDELAIKPEDVTKIKNVAKLNPFSLIKDAILPNVYGNDLIKKALVLQLFGGVKKKRQDDFQLRGDTHILLCGDPGTVKSGILTRMTIVWPKAKYTSAAGSTGVGLTGSVTKDEFTKGFSLEAGALSLANKGMCAIDEFDKTPMEETNKIHEALEQQTISIAKANIQETLPAETTILAAANPKKGRFDLYEPIPPQISLSPTLLNRFDLIFILKDIPNQQEDRDKAKFILSKHKSTKPKKTSDNMFSDLAFMRKYVAYARLHCKPVLTDEANTTIENYFVDMRSKSKQEGHFANIPITTRQLDALVRLSEAYAKTRLSDSVKVTDVEFAIHVFEDCMKEIAYDKDSGGIDVDIINIGTSASTRNKITIVYEAVKAVSKDNSDKVAPYQDIFSFLKDRGFEDEKQIEGCLDKLKRDGDIIEPFNGKYAILP